MRNHRFFYTLEKMNLTTTQLKLKILNHIRKHDVAILLDSNNCKGACDISKYEFVAAFGAKKYISFDKDCFERLQNFKNENPIEYIFTTFAYDLKNELEELSSNHPNSIEFPNLIAFIPEELILINEKGEIIHGKETVAKIETEEESFINNIPNNTITFQSKVEKQEYVANVEQIKNHIIEGDVYELNYCMEFFAEDVDVNPYSTYQKLMQTSPVPYGAFFKWHSQYLLCASPERFICKLGEKVYSQPIKGTAKRSKNKEEDEQLKLELFNSEKERAENLMIVDLVRNDLAITAETGTVKVQELFGIYTFPQVHQMISTIQSTSSTKDTIAIIKHAFPMGSMTGAPKIKAMQLIEKYETTKRGLYSGSIGYFSPNDDFDFNVIIRSLQYNATKNYLSFEVGSAITYDSIAEQEYEECLLKAEAMLKVFQGNT